MSNESIRHWEHKEGDQYVVVVGSVWMNAFGHGINYDVSVDTHNRLGYAIAEGFVDWDRSDDFNIVAFRKGAPWALLWMNDIVDDDVPEEIIQLLDER